MAIKTKNGTYRCGYCGKEYSKDQEADTCKQSHNLVYLAISENDLSRLHKFLFFKDDNLLTESLLTQISNAVKVLAVKDN